MGRKEQLVTEIRVGMSVLGMPIATINEQTRGYSRKKIAELEPIAVDINKQLKAAGKLRGQPPRVPAPLPTIDDALKICEEQIDGRQDTYAELWRVVKGVLERAKAELGAR